MKIIQIIPDFGFGGAEIMCENLVYELLALNHEVIVLSMYDNHSEIAQRMEKSGVEIRYLGKKGGFDFSMFWKMLKILKNEKPDVIHTHLYTGKYAFPAAVIAGVKRKVHTIHSIATKELGKKDRTFNKFFYKHFGVIPVALSKEVCLTVEEEYGLPKEKIPVVLNGSSLLKCIEKTDYSVNGNFKVLHVGSFKEAKNHFGLINAFEIFNNKYPDTELNLIGYGELQSDIEKLVEKKGLSHNVNFLGKQENVFPFLHKADIFTLPSLYEGISLALIEAMGTGLPIVTTAVGGVPDMLNDECAVFVSTEPQDIAGGFEKYYKDFELRHKHGTKVKAEAERFSAKKMAENYLEIYK
ncbi:MAG: glycosyltransferase [Clostridia bacterium]|nr:glycosyltransferase [Clostridia bacterium]